VQPRARALALLRRPWKSRCAKQFTPLSLRLQKQQQHVALKIARCEARQNFLQWRLAVLRRRCRRRRSSRRCRRRRSSRRCRCCIRHLPLLLQRLQQLGLASCRHDEGGRTAHALDPHESRNNVTAVDDAVHGQIGVVAEDGGKEGAALLDTNARNRKREHVAQRGLCKMQTHVTAPLIPRAVHAAADVGNWRGRAAQALVADALVDMRHVIAADEACPEPSHEAVPLGRVGSSRRCTGGGRCNSSGRAHGSVACHTRRRFVAASVCRRRVGGDRRRCVGRRCCIAAGLAHVLCSCSVCTRFAIQKQQGATTQALSDNADHKKRKRLEVGIVAH
jgi:hypothetical protein